MSSYSLFNSSTILDLYLYSSRTVSFLLLIILFEPMNASLVYIYIIYVTKEKYIEIFWINISDSFKSLLPVKNELPGGGDGSTKKAELEGDLLWGVSADGLFQFPVKVLSGLNSLEWQRVAVRMHIPPMALSMHVFLIGKKSEQFTVEHQMSGECIRCLIEILAD